MTKGRPSEGHPPDLALKNNNSIAKTACNLPPNIFGGPGFPMQVQARIKVLSLDVCFAYATHQLLTQWDDWLLDMIGFVSVMPTCRPILPTGLNFADQFCPLASILPTGLNFAAQFCPPVFCSFCKRIPQAIERTIPYCPQAHCSLSLNLPKV